MIRNRKTKEQIVSKAIIFNAQGQILVLKKAEPKSGMGYFDLPGGKHEQMDQDRFQAVEREVFEETGLEIKFLSTKPLGKETFQQKNKNRTLRIVRYATRTIDDKSISLDPEEHTDYAWIDPQDLLNQQNCPDWLDDVDWKNKTMKGIRKSIEKAIALKTRRRNLRRVFKLKPPKGLFHRPDPTFLNQTRAQLNKEQRPHE